MTHKTLTSALALALTLAATAGAQSPDRDNRVERPRGAQQDSVGRRGPRGGPERMLLRGITLSAEQRTKLADLRRSERAQFDAKRPNGANGQNGAVRPRRERGDTTGMAARRAEMQKRFEQRIASVRNILTAEQRTQFDKNVAEVKTRRSGGPGFRKSGRSASPVVRKFGGPVVRWSGSPRTASGGRCFPRPFVVSDRRTSGPPDPRQLPEQSRREIRQISPPVRPGVAAAALVVHVLDAVLREQCARRRDGAVQEVLLPDRVVHELELSSRRA